MVGDKVAYAIGCKNDKTQDPLPPQVPKGYGARRVQVLILFISLSVIHTMRSQLSLSLVAMTTNVLETEDNDTITRGSNMTVEGINKPDLRKWNVYRRYDWNKATQEMITVSFFIGYTSMNLPMGIIAQKIGGKKPIMFALAVNGLISVITPWVPIFGGWISLSVCRFLQGATQAAFYPSIHTVLGKWAPLSERARLSTYIYTGSQCGTILIFQIAGFFAGSPSFGWPATFWLCGVLSFISFLLVWRLVTATPHEHPTISLDEMTYILEGGSADVVPKKRATPWKSILKSKAVWGLVAAHCGSTPGYILVLTQIPTYMNYVLGVDIKKNGLFSSLPYIAMYCTAIMSGYLADYAANKKILSIANIRRIANSIGLVVAALFLVAFSYITSTLPAVITLIVSMGLHSSVHVGFHINQIDLAPNFAGPIMGLGNMLANLTSLIVPVIVSNIVKDDLTNQSKWQTVFLIIAGLQFVTNTLFVIFVKGEVQPWNFYGEDDEVNVEDNALSKMPEQEEKKNST